MFRSDPTSDETCAKLHVGLDGGLVDSETFGINVSFTQGQHDGDVSLSKGEWIRRFHTSIANVEVTAEGEADIASAADSSAEAGETDDWEMSFHESSVEHGISVGPRGDSSISVAIDRRSHSRWLLWLGLTLAAAVAIVLFMLPTDAPIDKPSPKLAANSSSNGGGDSRPVAPAAELPSTNFGPSDSVDTDESPNQIGKLLSGSYDANTDGLPADTDLPAEMDSALAGIPGIQDVLGMAPKELFAEMPGQSSQEPTEPGETEGDATLGLPESMSDDSWETGETDRDEKNLSEATESVPETPGDDAPAVPDAQNIVVELSGSGTFVEHDSIRQRLPAKMIVTASLEPLEDLTVGWIDDINGESAKRARGLLVVHESGKDPTDAATPVIAVAIDVRAGRGIKTRLRTAVRTGADVGWQNVDMTTLQTYAQSIANRSVQMDQAIAQLSSLNANTTSRQRAIARLQVDQIKAASKQLALNSRRLADLIALTEKFAAKNELKLAFAVAE